MKKRPAPQQSFLRSIFNYDHETGVLFHRNRPEVMFKSSRQFLNWNSRYPGTPVGSITKGGYLATRINGEDYYVHVLIWAYVNGDDGCLSVDHINRNRCDNRISNLRLATNSQNLFNSGCSRNSLSREKGVHKRKDCDTWRAVIDVDGKRINLGSFKSKEEAVEAYRKASIELHGEYSVFN
ncbi:TPA: HNH endonuclease [Klebsiella aerogenes]